MVTGDGEVPLSFFELPLFSLSLSPSSGVLIASFASGHGKEP
jgi:hypothetical protein